MTNNLPPSTLEEILGVHPSQEMILGQHLSAVDSKTDSGVIHRALLEKNGERENFISYTREILKKHHASEEQIGRHQALFSAYEALGFEQKIIPRLLPTNVKTQKGNLAEIMLAEYLVASTGAQLPVYRLRHNPNIDQSMKGNDVLAFDLDSNPVRIIVGESKFRKTSSKEAVIEIVNDLIRSHSAIIPVSLQFVADRLFETGNSELGDKILNCTLLFSQGTLRLDYVGLLMSDIKSSEKVHRHAQNSLKRLAILSLGIKNPTEFNDSCYNGLEQDLEA